MRTVFRLLGLLAILGIIRLPTAAQPQIPSIDVIHQSQPVETSNVTWGTSAKWIVSLEKAENSGTVNVYDLQSGRLARQIRILGVDYMSTLFAIPAKDQFAVNAGTIKVYDILSGEKAFDAADSDGCRIVNVVGSEIAGDCPASMTGVERFGTAKRKVWDGSSGIALREEPVNAAKAPLAQTQDDSWVAEFRIGFSGKQVLSAIGRQYLGAVYPRSQDSSSNVAAQYSMFRYSITDTATKAVVMEGQGQVSAISKLGRSAVALTKDGVFLISVPSGKRLKKLGAGLLNLADGYSTAKTVSGGKQYLVSGLSGQALIDAGTGATIARFDPALGTTGAMSPNGDRIAYAQGSTLVLVSTADPSQRQLLGTQTSNVSLAPTVDLAKAYSDSLEKSRADLTTMRKDGKRQIKEELKFEKSLPKFNARKRQEMQEEHNLARTRQQQERNRSQFQTYAPAVKEYTKDLLNSYKKFGGPAVIPPEVVFLDSGRVMAVLAADLSWNTWDTATGNRLPFRTVRNDFDKVLELFQNSYSGHNDDAVYNYLRRSLTNTVPGAAIQPAKPILHYASSNWACQSQSGEYGVELKRELDPKKWKAGKHRVQSATLRSASGAATDLLEKGIDFSALSNPTLYEADELLKRQQCAVSDDGKYIVLEKLRVGSAPNNHLSLREKTALEISGKQTADSLALYETATGKLACELEGGQDFHILAGNLSFSPTSHYIYNGRLRGGAGLVKSVIVDRDLSVWDASSCRRVFNLQDSAKRSLGFSSDEKLLFVTPSPKDQSSPATFGIEAWDVTTGSKVLTIHDIVANLNLINTTANKRILFGADQENALGFWDFRTGEKLATMRALQEGEWLITTPAGYFDGSPRGWTQIVWRVPGQGMVTQPAEIFFNDFYRPGLLAEFLQGNIPSAPRNVQQVDRRQPTVRIAADNTTQIARTVKLVITVEEGLPNAERQNASGVRDVRLFRNGTLVKVWRGDADLQGGKATFETAVPLAEGRNEFVAYAFNHDNVKSADAAVSVQNNAERLPATAYILTIGVNEYENSEFNLKFAVSDATVLGEQVAEEQKKLAQFQRQVQVTLLDKEATRENILLALSILSGEHSSTALSAAYPKSLAQLKAAEPQDVVIIYFAGHGIAAGDRFFLVPHDLGYSGPRSALQASIQTVFSHSISDLDLEKAFEPIQAGHSLLIIDACNSGKVLDSEEQRRGPMNNRGLAQLAYEKGIYVLTAAQGYQAALESSRLGHGYLTYALAEEGLKTSLADKQPTDGRITASEWFEYASFRVPELQMEALQHAAEAGRKLTFEEPAPSNSKEKGQLQTPRFYYRRDLNGGDPIVSRVIDRR